MQDLQTRVGQRDLYDLRGTLDGPACVSYEREMIARLPCLVLIALALPFSVASQAAEKRYAIADFDQIQIFGSFNVVVQTGRATSVTASGDADALEMVSIVSSNRVLTIQTLTKARSSWKDSPHAAAKVFIVLPQLKGLKLLGSGAVTAGEMRGIATNILLSGSGQLGVTRLTSDNARIRLDGSGRISVAGTAKNVDANVSGSGDLDAARLLASDLKIASSTSGRVTAKAIRAANIKHNGAGDIQIAGTSNCLVENTGAGTVRCEN